MKTSIAEVMRRIRPMSRQQKIHHLRSVISMEPKRGIRRAELEAILKPILNTQLKHEHRQERLAS